MFQSDNFSTPTLAGLLSFIIAAVLLNVEFYIPTVGITPISTIISNIIYPSVYTSYVVTFIISGLVSYEAYRSALDETEAFMKKFLLVIGSIVAFSAGGSQVGLAVGPLLPLSGEIPLSVTGIVIGGGIGILIGSWTGSPRMIKAVSQDYAQLGPRRSVSALTPAFLLAQTAILFGVPISFNQMIVSCIVGAGMGSKDNGEEGIGKQKMIRTIGAWIGTLILSFVLTYSLMTLVLTYL